MTKKNKIFFTADLHLYHTNIIKHCNRPFETIEEMNNVLVDNWNKVVGPKDTIYILGDFVWGTNKRKTEKLIKELSQND